MTWLSRKRWNAIHSTNPLGRLIGEIKPRTDAIGIFSNEAAIYRLVGARLLEQSDEWVLHDAETLAAVGEIPSSACPP